MLLAMCADTGMLISVLVFMLISGFVACGLVLLALMGIVKLIGAVRSLPEAVILSPENVP